jgi:hypothetical protein
MGDERALSAIARIERALARVESAATRASGNESQQTDERLEAAHSALRGKVEQAIAQIDRLLGAEAH